MIAKSSLIISSGEQIKLVFTSDAMPGYKRLRRGGGFRFVLPDGRTLADKEERRRILSLAIPPAYQNVWICTLENGHLQATGIDARGRKQYRYHPHWHASAGEKKFGMLGDFAMALPKIRMNLRRQLDGPDLTRERVIAGIVSLLDLTGYRIGNSRYERDNHSFGLSSLLNRHLKQEGDQLNLKFRGKSGQEHRARIADPRLAHLVADLQELPGQHLFRYEDALGQAHDIGTTDVNGWLKEIGGGDYTAKQFRTWKATVLCARELAKDVPAESKTAQERVIRQAIKATSLKLHHTAATCRKYYIHPLLLSAYRSGELFSIMNAPAPRLGASGGMRGLHSDERRVFAILSLPAKRRRIPKINKSMLTS